MHKYVSGIYISSSLHILVSAPPSLFFARKHTILNYSYFTIKKCTNNNEYRCVCFDFRPFALFLSMLYLYFTCIGPNILIDLLKWMIGLRIVCHDGIQCTFHQRWEPNFGFVHIRRCFTVWFYRYRRKKVNVESILSLILDQIHAAYPPLKPIKQCSKSQNPFYHFFF